MTSVKNPMCRDEWAKTASATETARNEPPSRKEARRSDRRGGGGQLPRLLDQAIGVDIHATRRAPLSGKGIQSRPMSPFPRYRRSAGIP